MSAPEEFCLSRAIQMFALLLLLLLLLLSPCRFPFPHDSQKKWETKILISDAGL